MIRTVIATVVSQMTANGKNAGFYKSITAATKSEINAKLDNQKLPVVALTAPIVSRVRLNQSGYKARTYPILLWFIWKSEPSWSDIDHDQKAIQPSVLAINNFLDLLEKHPEVESVNRDAQEIEFTNMFDANTSGTSINVTVTLRNTNSICTE